MMNQSKVKRTTKRTVAFVSAVAICAVSVLSTAVTAFAKDTENVVQDLRIAVISDDHYLSPDLIAATDDYTTDLNSDRKVFTESDAIIDDMLEQVEKDSPDILMISGDLTKDGEYEDHTGLAKKLAALKKKLPNLKVYVVPGNHDVNNSNGKNFNTEDGNAVPATRTTPQKFVEAYKDIVFSDSSIVARYTPPKGAQSGQLSYVARPADGFTIIAIDSARYSADNTDSGKDEHETSGQISDDLRAWVTSQIKDAESRGDTVIGLMHHGLVEHFTMEPTILPMYLVNNYKEIANEFADAGLDYVFTGHMHANDVAKLTTENGNTLLDIETGSALTYPSPMRFVTITREISAGGNVSETIDCKTKINRGPITFTDPATGEIRTIENITDFEQAHGFSKDMLTTTITGFIHPYIDSKLLDKLISDIIADLCVVQVSGDKNLIDFANYVYQSHLAGTDDGINPAWVNDGIAKIQSGELLDEVLDVLTKNLAGLPASTVTLFKSSVPVIGQIFGIIIDDTKLSFVTNFLDTLLSAGVNGAQKLMPSAFDKINEFLYNVVDSMSNDKNFTQDNNFTVTRTYQSDSLVSLVSETPLGDVKVSYNTVASSLGKTTETIASTGDDISPAIGVTAVIFLAAATLIFVKRK